MQSSSRTDAELIRECAKRPEAFVEVCERHAHAIRGWLRSESGSDELSAELLAETLAQAWYSRRRFRDPGGGSARPWLFGIASNLLRRHRRAGAVERRARLRLGIPLEFSSEDAYADVDARLSASTAARRLSLEIGALSPEQRQVLRLRVVAGLEYHEIATRLAITTGTARIRVFRALKALRGNLPEGVQ